MEQKDSTTSSDGKNDATGKDTDQPVISESPPRPDPNAQVSARPPRRLQNLAVLYLRENVQAVIQLAGVKRVGVTAKLMNGGGDSKIINVGDGGSIVIIVLSDNPDYAAAGFNELRPPRAGD